MTTKLEQILKFIPAFTFICYLCGVVIYNSFLLEYGIIDTNIVNIRFIEAGLLFLTIAPFILVPTLLLPRKSGLLISILSALAAFNLYNSAFGNMNFNFLWKSFIVITLLNAFFYFIVQKYKAAIKDNKLDLTELPIEGIILLVVSLLVFSIYFKEIKTNFGGGKSYKKVLILKDKKDNLLKTDSLFHSDTLTIIYENGEFIYYKTAKSVLSIRRDLVEGEVMVK